MKTPTLLPPQLSAAKLHAGAEARMWRAGGDYADVKGSGLGASPVHGALVSSEVILGCAYAERPARKKGPWVSLRIT